MGGGAQLYGGHTKRNEDGSTGGWGGHIGLNETIDGTNLQAVNVGGDIGWGGDGFYGARANATLAGVQHDPAAAGESGFWGGIRTMDAGFSAYHDSQAGQGELGYRADIISGELGYRNVDADSRTDRGMRAGAALGVTSGAARWYNQDADGDGRNEYGFGLSVPVGPVGLSFDYTTETPVGDALSMLVPGGLALNAAMDWAGLGEYAPGTLLQDGAEAAWDVAGDVWDGASDLAGDAWDGAGSALSSAGDAVGSFFSGW